MFVCLLQMTCFFLTMSFKNFKFLCIFLLKRQLRFLVREVGTERSSIGWIAL